MDSYQHNMRMKQYRIWMTILLVLYVLLMLFGAAYPRPQDIPVFSGHTKYFHFFGFSVLMIVLLSTLKLYRFKHKYALSSIIIVLFAVFTEYLQLFTASREFSYYDMLIDIGGGALGLVLWVIFRWIFFKR